MPKAGLLVWMDLEMTGLDPERERIIELATIVTDADLNIVGEGPEFVIHQNDDILGAMDDWNRRHHTDSGLVARVRESTVDEPEAESQTLAFIAQFCAGQSTPLAGNSIHQDRRFLRRYMPKLEAYLHYRNVDVSTVKELVRRWNPAVCSACPPKKNSHRALDDIRESIEELRYYRDHAFVKAQPPASSDP